MSKTISILVALATVAAAGQNYASAQPPAARPDVGRTGRYQIAASLDSSRIFVIDTVTGQCWSKASTGHWRDEGNPTQARDTSGAKPAKAPAATLNLPSKSVEMVIVQREERAIPGSDGSVRIRLGDITDGQVLLSVVTADEELLLERTSVSQDSSVDFSVAKKKYTIHIRELRNVILGDDFAKLTVSEASEKPLPDRRRSPDERK